MKDWEYSLFRNILSNCMVCEIREKYEIFIPGAGYMDKKNVSGYKTPAYLYS